VKEVIQPPPIVNFYDDLDLRKGEKTPATGTVLVGLDNKLRELDVSEEHYTMIVEFLTPLLEAGRKVSGATASGSQGPMDEKRLSYLRGLRTWVKDNDIKNKAGNGFAYETNTGTGKTYYPVWLTKQYDEHLTSAGAKG
jgi:hypothetical protein